MVAGAGHEGHALVGQVLAVQRLIAGVDDKPSGKPQLIDTTDTPGWAAAVATPAIRSESDSLLASTRTILAPGADGVNPFDVERFFQFPVAPPGPAGSTVGKLVGLAVLVEDGQERRRRAVLLEQIGPPVVMPNCGVKGVQGLVNLGSS